MSLYDYMQAQQLRSEPFDALIMAAVLKADSWNLARLKATFPELVAEVERRFNAPGGRLPEDS